MCKGQFCPPKHRRLGQEILCDVEVTNVVLHVSLPASREQTAGSQDCHFLRRSDTCSLKRMPVDCRRRHRSFVRYLGDDPYVAIAPHVFVAPQVLVVDGQDVHAASPVNQPEQAGDVPMRRTGTT